MADTGAPAGPNFDQIALQNRLSQSSTGGSGMCLGGLLRDVNYSGLSLQNVGPLKGTPTVFNGSGKGHCLSIPDKIIAALQQMGEGCMKSLASGVAPASAQDVYGHGDIHHGLGGGGSFTSMVSGGSDVDTGHSFG